MSEESLNEVTQAAFHLGQVSERKRQDAAISFARQHWQHEEILPGKLVDEARPETYWDRHATDRTDEKLVFDERCARCQFERILEGQTLGVGAKREEQ